jgi:hypothetical protein
MLARLVGRLLLIALLPVTALAQGVPAMDARLDTLFGEHQAYRKFLRQLQAAVSSQQRVQVARLVSYPLVTHLRGHQVTIRTPQQFLQHYGQLLPAASVEAITAQRYEALFANAQGAMIGAGEVWFGGVCADDNCRQRKVRITAINPPERPAP